MSEVAEVGVERSPTTVAELVHRLCEFPLDMPVDVLFSEVDEEGLHWDIASCITDLVHRHRVGRGGVKSDE